MDFFEDFEDERNILSEIEEKKNKTFRNVLNRKVVSDSDLDEIFLM